MSAGASRLTQSLKRVRLLKDRGEKDLSIVDIIVALDIFQRGQCLQKDLANFMWEEHEINEVLLSNTLKKLIDKHKFVSRSPDSANYRLNVLDLTMRGKAFVEDLLKPLGESVHDNKITRLKVPG